MSRLLIVGNSVAVLQRAMVAVPALKSTATLPRQMPGEVYIERSGVLVSACWRL